MINPADDEINVLLPLIAAGIFTFFVICGVVVYKVFDLDSAIRRNASQNRVSVVQSALVSIGGVIFVSVGYLALTIVIAVAKRIFALITS